MGNILRKMYESLKKSVFSHRENEYSIHRSRSDHPERLHPDQLLPDTNIAPITEVVAPFKKCSDFYMACRDNQIKKVTKLLDTISQDEIDQLEPNGSTALHAASFHGHGDIVRLLLERGADRAIPNKFQCLPFDEAKSENGWKKAERKNAESEKCRK